MNLQEEHIDLFDAYLQSSLSEKEVLKFDARLSYDVEFKKSFETYCQLEKGIKTHFRNEIKSDFKKIDKLLDEKSDTSHVRKLPKSKIIIAIGSAAAILLFLVYFNVSSADSYNELVSSYWETDNGIPVKMSSKGKYDEAMNAYKQNDWDNAEELLMQIDSDTANYYLGIINYNQKEYTSAIDYFNKVSVDSKFLSRTKFRLALILLIENPEKGKQQLQEISASASLYSKQARAVLNKM